MEKFQKLIETLEVLNLLRDLLNEESEKYLECKEIREPLEEAAEQIAKIYEEFCKDPKDEPLDGSSVN